MVGSLGIRTDCLCFSQYHQIAINYTAKKYGQYGKSGAFESSAIYARMLARDKLNLSLMPASVLSSTK